MKKIIIGATLCIVIFLTVACDSSFKIPDDPVPNDSLTDEELYDIFFLFKAPLTNEKKDLSEIIKVVFTENDSSNDYTMAIELDKRIVHANPTIFSSGVLSTELYKDIDGLKEVINLLKKHRIDQWDSNYTYEDPSTYEDGYGWSLWLQYGDGTAQRHHGSGSFKSEVVPNNFQEFVNDLDEFINNITEDSQVSHD